MRHADASPQLWSGPACPSCSATRGASGVANGPSRAECRPRSPHGAAPTRSKGCWPPGVVGREARERCGGAVRLRPPPVGVVTALRYAPSGARYAAPPATQRIFWRATSCCCSTRPNTHAKLPAPPKRRGARGAAVRSRSPASVILKPTPDRRQPCGSGGRGRPNAREGAANQDIARARGGRGARRRRCAPIAPPLARDAQAPRAGPQQTLRPSRRCPLRGLGLGPSLPPSRLHEPRQRLGDT